MTTHVYVLMSESFEGRGFPIASYIYEPDADFMKLQKEREQINVLPSFHRYYKVEKVPLYSSIDDQRIRRNES